MADPVPTTAPDAHETAFEAFGVRIGMSTNDAHVRSRLPDVVPPHSRPCDPREVAQHYSVHTADGITFTVRYDLRDGVPAQPWDPASYVATDVDRELALGLLDSHVHGCVALNAPGRIFIGAGAVAHHNRAILLPGPALSGKTTLVSALVDAGCDYYSDQYAVLDERGLVHPYARPLVLANQAQPETNHRGDIGSALAGMEPLPVGAVVATSYRPGAEWRPRRLSRGEAVLVLLSHAVPAQHRTEHVMHAINGALEDKPVMLASDRDEAEPMATQLLAELERKPTGRA